MPFRWMEILFAPCPVSPDHVRQEPLYHPYDLSESSFKSDCDALNHVCTFCKHSIRATTYTGLFTDGNRERLPYEADSYITQLGTYAITSDQTLTRLMTDYLATHTTWPTEWKQFFIRMVYEDWRHSGKTDLMRKHWTLMRDVKSWRQLRRTDGLLVTPGAKMAPSPGCDAAQAGFRGDFGMPASRAAQAAFRRRAHAAWPCTSRNEANWHRMECVHRIAKAVCVQVWRTCRTSSAGQSRFLWPFGYGKTRYGKIRMTYCG